MSLLDESLGWHLANCANHRRQRIGPVVTVIELLAGHAFRSVLTDDVGQFTHVGNAFEPHHYQSGELESARVREELTNGDGSRFVVVE